MCFRSLQVYSLQVIIKQNTFLMFKNVFRDLGLNEITEIDGAPFQNLHNLQDLLLDRNQLNYLSADIFKGLQKLQIL